MFKTLVDTTSSIPQKLTEITLLINSKGGAPELAEEVQE